MDAVSDDDLMPVTRGMLWEAFKAGFAASGEGWNGEYGGPGADAGPPLSELREAFDRFASADPIAEGAREAGGLDSSPAWSALTRQRVWDREEGTCTVCADTSPDPEGAEAAALAPESTTAEEAET